MCGLGITSLGVKAESRLGTANFTDHFSEVGNNSRLSVHTFINCDECAGPVGALEGECQC